MLRFHVAEARDVDAVGPVTDRALVGESRNGARRARPVVMVHDVPAERAAGVGEAVGEARALGVEQQSHRLDRRRAQKDDARRVLAATSIVFASITRTPLARPCFGSYSTSATTLFGTQREVARLLRRGQRRAQAVEVRMRDAPALAGTTVVAGEAPVVILRQNRRASDRHHAFAAERLENLRTRVGLDAVICIGGRNSPSGSCDRPSCAPVMPMNLSTCEYQGAMSL